ncbi:M23 family metallopeptidase [Ornithinibacillus sp. JPR2-1]|uniref:M23 family metallopeptidase n=1 Tax=Ornithinibacillus sp. JPR2-1 TaxID=2094019 RepID=UPI0031E004E1
MFSGKRKQAKQKNSLLKKAIISTGLVTVLATGVVFAEEKDTVDKVHHVYVNGEYIGQVSDEQIVNQVIDAKLQEEEEKYQDVDLSIGEDVKLVSELVFNPTYNNDSIKKYLENHLSVQAQAVELTIGDKVVGYFENEQDAHKVIEDYKLTYTDKETLDLLEAAKSASSDTPKELVDLEVGESTIVDVTLSEDVSYSTKKVNPKEVLTVAEGLALLEKGTLKEETHAVQEGEVLGKIASQYDLTIETLLTLNPSLKEDSLLQIGQELHVTELKPFVDVIVTKEEKKKEDIAFETEIVESDELYKGEEEVQQEGSDGEKVVHYAIEIRNGKVAVTDVVDEEMVKEPVNKVIVKGTKVIPSRGTGDLSWPTVGGYISSYMGNRWGSYHKGIDIARPSNRSILAADNGTIVSAGYQGGFGNKIEIDHNNGMKTIYAHLSSIDVEVGQTVEKGQQIGVMGSTGNSTGVHLHFEVYKDGKLENPVDYLK